MHGIGVAFHGTALCKHTQSRRELSSFQCQPIDFHRIYWKYHRSCSPSILYVAHCCTLLHAFFEWKPLLAQNADFRLQKAILFTVLILIFRLCFYLAVISIFWIPCKNEHLWSQANSVLDYSNIEQMIFNSISSQESLCTFECVCVWLEFIRSVNKPISTIVQYLLICIFKLLITKSVTALCRRTENQEE